MQALLASLVVSMGVKDAAYKAGMASARAEAKKTQQDFDKSTDGMANAVERTAKRVNEATVRIADAVIEAGQKVRTTGLALTAGLTLGLGGIAKVSKDTASDFQAAMNNVRSAMLDASPETLDKLRAAALRLGPEMGKSARDAAGAIESLAKNGLSAADILSGGLENALKLGVLGQTDLGKAADATTDILQQFHLTTDALPGVVNKVSGALDASKLDFNGYADAIGMVGGIAGGLGYSFDDMNTALAAVIPLMTGGSDAGTSFKTFLLSLVPQSKDAAETMSKLGISFRNADGSMKDLSQVAEVLNTKLSKLTDASRQDALTKMFGTDGMRVALGLMKAGAKGIADVQAQIDKASADQKIEVLLDGEAAATQRLSAAWENLKIAIGSAGILQAFTLIKDAAASVINAIAGVPRWFMIFTVAVGAVAASTGPMILAIYTLSKIALPLLLLRLGPVALGFATLINPMGVVLRLLAQLAISMGASTMLGLLGTRLLALAGPVGLVVSVLALLVPLLMKTAEASDHAKQATDAARDANAKAVDMTNQLATATKKARLEIVAKAKADRQAAVEAMKKAQTDMHAARAALVRAKASLPTIAAVSMGSGSYSGGGGAGQSANANAYQQGQQTIAQARAELQSTIDTVGTWIDTANKYSSVIAAGSAPADTLVDMSFDDPKGGRNSKTKGRDASRDEDNYLDELGRIRVERLQAEADLTGSARTRYTADIAALEEDRAAYARQLQDDEGLTAARRTTLLAAKDQAMERRRDVVQQALTFGLEQEAYDLAKARNDAAQDDVRASIDAADSVAARRDGELRLLDLQRQQEEADLNLILATKATGTAEWNNASLRKDALDGIYGQRRAATLRGNETSAQSFSRELNASGDRLRESVEDAGVGALRDLNGELSDAILGAKSLGDAFANMGRRIIGSLMDIAIQQAIIKPLATSLFGAGGGGGLFASIGNVFASSFGGGRAAGGGVSADEWYWVGERGPEKFYPGISGTVVPNEGKGAGRSGNTQYIDMRGAMVDRDVWAKVDQIATSRAGEAYQASARHTESTLAGITRQRL